MSLEGGFEGGPNNVKAHSDLVTGADFKSWAPPVKVMSANFQTLEMGTGRSRSIEPEASPPDKQITAPRKDAPSTLGRDNLEKGDQPITREGAVIIAYQDDPSKSPADRAIAASRSVTASGALMQEHRDAFESAIKAADAEMENGGSPRLKGLEGKLTDMEKTLADPTLASNLESKAENLNAQLRGLPADKFQVYKNLMRFHNQGVDLFDSQINSLFSDKDGKTFLDQVKEFTDLKNLPEAAAKLKQQTIPIEQAENSFTRIAYARALADSSDPTNLSTAKGLVQQAIRLKPDLQYTDEITQGLIKKLGVKNETPL